MLAFDAMHAAQNGHAPIGSILTTFSRPPAFRSLVVLVCINSVPQATIFATFGLLLSPHSSALKNLAFASRHAAVVELQPGTRAPNPSK